MNDIEYLLSKAIRNDIANIVSISNICEEHIDESKFSIPSKICRFSALTTFLLNNLEKKTLTITSPNEYNDLYDSSMHFNSYSMHYHKILGINKAIQLSKIGKPLDINTILDKGKWDDFDRYQMNFLFQITRICCFSTSCDDIKMWGTYADNNKGICMEYCVNEFNDLIQKSFFPVIYCKKPYDSTKLCDENKVLLAGIISSTTKYEVWKNENEWRLIILASKRNGIRETIEKIPIPKCIILGNAFLKNYSNDNKVLVDKLIKYIRENRILVKYCKGSIGNYEMNIENIEIDNVEEYLNLPRHPWLGRFLNSGQG